MRAISLIQPYATLIALGYKVHETRSWNTKHRGPLAIHASAGKPAWSRQAYENEPLIQQVLAYHGFTFDNLPRGVLVCTGKLEQTLRIGQPGQIRLGVLNPRNLTEIDLVAGDYTPGRYAWKMTDIRALPEPVPCKGALSLWEVPPNLLP